MTSLRGFRPLAALLLLFCLTAPLAAADKTGLVLLHGKLGMPSKAFGTLAPQLEAEGVLVDMPEMPWSRNREYGASYDQAMEEINASVARLRAKGATRIVVGGHSMGAAAALIFGSRHSTDGLILLALGHSPQAKSLQTRYSASVTRARGLVADSNANDKHDFDDFDASKKPPTFKVTTTASNYLSYFAPNGIANTLTAADKIPANVPVLWVDGTDENPALKSYNQSIYSAIGSSAKQRIEVEATHISVPHKSGNEVLNWLRNQVK